MADLPESIYFLTFHKTASSMVSSLLLPNVSNLKHVDFAEQLFLGRDVEVRFEKLGELYGPIRLSLDEGPIYEALNQPLIDGGLLDGKRVVAMVRDPRDILVSLYFSIAQSHVYSQDERIASIQRRNRQALLEQGLAAYVAAQSPGLNQRFLYLWDLLNQRSDSVLLRYEDLINRYDDFKSELAKVFAIDESVLDQIYRSTRPVEDEDETRHRRSGKVGGFREKLSSGEIDALNTALSSSLAQFGYAP